MFFRLAVSAAGERLLTVRFPLHSIVHFKRRRMLFVIACIFVLALLLNVHFLFSLRVVSVPVCNSKLTTIGLSIATKSSEPFSYNYGIYSLGAFVIAAQIIPLLLLITLNSSLIFSLSRAAENDEELISDASSQLQNENQISVVVAAMIASFVLFNIPSAVTWTIHLANGLQTAMPNNFHTAVEVANILVATGKCINIFVYCWCSVQFRRRFRGNLYTVNLQSASFSKRIVGKERGGR